MLKGYRKRKVIKNRGREWGKIKKETERGEKERELCRKHHRILSFMGA
jgi:hypothetical protein